MAIHYVARFLKRSPALSSQLRQTAIMDNSSPISAALRWISVTSNRFPHSKGEERARPSFGTDRLPGALFSATSATVHTTYSISATPVIGGAGH